MVATVNASTSAGVVITPDNSGVLALQSSSTTAVTLDASQNATFAGSVKTNTLTSASATALTLQSAGTTAITVDTSQNVGIGTASPTQKLHVLGAMLIGNYGGNQYLYFDSTSAYVGRNSSTGDVWLNNAGSQNTIFGVGGTEKMRIDSSGNVGIGNASPTATLDTYIGSGPTSFGTFANSVRINGGNTSGKYVSLTFGGYGSNAPAAISYAVTTGTNNTLGDLIFGTRSVTTDTLPSTRMTISSSGSIGAPTGTNIYNASDARLKKNIQPLTKGLDAVNALKPVSFNWIEDFCPVENDKIMYGFVAQDTREVDENLVEGFNNGSDVVVGDLTVEKAMRVNEKFIIPMLTKAIQELKAINDTQAETINALTARIVALEGV